MSLACPLRLTGALRLGFGAGSLAESVLALDNKHDTRLMERQAKRKGQAKKANQAAKSAPVWVRVSVRVWVWVRVRRRVMVMVMVIGLGLGEGAGEGGESGNEVSNCAGECEC